MSRRASTLCRFSSKARVLVGFFFLAVLWVVNAVFVIIAAIKASDGEFYRYPMTIRFLQ